MTPSLSAEVGRLWLLKAMKPETVTPVEPVKLSQYSVLRRSHALSWTRFYKQATSKWLRLSLCVLLCLMTVREAFCQVQAEQKIAVADSLVTESFEADFDDVTQKESGWAGPWMTSQSTPAVRARISPAELTDYGAEIHGTGERNNPLRRQLATSFDGPQLFVRFLISYDANSIDKAPASDGEFFVLWLDSSGGADTSTHSSGIPNIGIHVDSRNRNAFMARFGPESSAFAPVELTGDRTFLVVAKISKTAGQNNARFDRIDLWVNPNPEQPAPAQATSFHSGRLRTINWLGFSTGRKTETGDRIVVDDLVVADSWEGLFALPPDSVTFPTPQSLSKRLQAETLDIPAKLLPRKVMPTQPTVSFRSDIFPIIKQKCFRCHSGQNPDAGYRLDLLDEVLGETTGEPLAVPGDAAHSRLVAAVAAPASSKHRMPPVGEGEPLSEQEIALVKTWIDEGLAWDDELLPPVSPRSDHWAFQRIERPDVPSVESPPFPIRTPVDAFVATKHLEHDIHSVPRAGTETLHRRLSLDLTGLPPHIVDEGDSDPGWAGRVDALLDSPHYGERWGRHWLDVARWAESNGYQHNRDRHHAWRYRDYVIDSFNIDKPFDQFITEQLAGDELEPVNSENIIATGFLSAARYSGNEKNKTLQRYDILVDIVNATGNAMLGLTFECCQCHNHKFDPISARDYYRFQGFFAKGQPVNVILPEDETGNVSQQDLEDESQPDLQNSSTDLAIALCSERQAIFDLTHSRLFAATRRKRPEGDIFILPKTVVKGMRPPERQRYDAIGRQLDAMPQTWAFYSPATATEKLPVPPLEMRWPLPYRPELSKAWQQRLYIRGDADNPGPVVSPGWPAVFGTVPAAVAESPKPRTELARWLTSRDNPLTARVWVNRIWQWHLGKGLVEESANFGLTTPRPEFQELLDWLAMELIENNWSTHHIHRLILNSSVYQFSSQFDEHNAGIDPDNHLFWRWVPRRLEAESLRDCMLASSGELSLEVGGASIRESAASQSTRRSIYLNQKRNVMPQMQNVFDGPSALTSCSIRRVSTVPLQPLFLLNSKFANTRAKALAEQIMATSDGGADDLHAVVKTVFRRILNRSPDQEELERSIEFLSATASFDQSLTSFCHALLNLNEFAYIP